MSCSSADEMLLAEKMRYPRTGKRGVPQQFPRRLYEMLEAESQSGSTTSPSSSSSDDIKDRSIVYWSSTGLAFRINDVNAFSNTILPKYFKTSKFSSFQRNLNLYGFAKVRKGPDVDMYFHPKFIRGDVDVLSELRKRTTAASKKKKEATSYPPQQIYSLPPAAIRTVSPIMPPNTNINTGHFNILQKPKYSVAGPPAKRYIHTLRNASMMHTRMPESRISNEEASLVSASSSDNDFSAVMTPPVRNDIPRRVSNIQYSTPAQAPTPSPSFTGISKAGRLDILAEAMRMVI